MPHTVIIVKNNCICSKTIDPSTVYCKIYISQFFYRFPSSSSPFSNAKEIISHKTIEIQNIVVTNFWKSGPYSQVHEL